MAPKLNNPAAFMKKLFGTDGMRGLAGEFPLDQKTIYAAGSSLARQYTEKLGRSPRFLTGRDTRESGEWIEKAFHAGAASAGAICESAAVITTPGVAFLTGEFDFDAGIVISASHNPYQDNGIKIFSPSGKKVGEDVERQIEKDIFDASTAEEPFEIGGLNTSRASVFAISYISHLRKKGNGFSAAGFKIVIDCANGASSEFAPKLFAALGADVIAINCDPNGQNINADCGSLHMDRLQERVVDEKADFGVAFDGDADRALFVDENGHLVDGDATLWIVAQYLQSHDKLENSTVVATVMSNIGLELALNSKGIKLRRTDVGDKYVLEELLKTGSEIGGEQSGHIILPHISLVGDGMMTALILLRAVIEKGTRFSEASQGFVRYPQILVNVKVSEKRPFADVPAIAEAAKQIESELNGEGRLLLRYSGTENLARVMIEGKDQVETDEKAHRLAGVIRDILG